MCVCVLETGAVCQIACPILHHFLGSSKKQEWMSCSKTRNIFAKKKNQARNAMYSAVLRPIILWKEKGGFKTNPRQNIEVYSLSAMYH